MIFKWKHSAFLKIWRKKWIVLIFCSFLFVHVHVSTSFFFFFSTLINPGWPPTFFISFRTNNLCDCFILCFCTEVSSHPYYVKSNKISIIICSTHETIYSQWYVQWAIFFFVCLSLFYSKYCVRLLTFPLT